MEERNIADIYCPSCGAAARYDIRRQLYVCRYCGGQVGIDEALQQKRGFRTLQQEKIREEARQYKLIKAECPGCGAEIAVAENEALTDCAFCGKSLVRSSYLKAPDMPEMIIPFRISEEEARQLLNAWCEKNRRKPEARHILAGITHLQGYYMPYELIRGPISCQVSRIDGGKTYTCGGYIDEVFVSCSRQVDNLLLNGMEPYELDELKEFDFAYTAGQRIKIRDIDDEALALRIEQEVRESYTPEVRKVLETKAIDIDANVKSVMRMPLLLPVYYLRLDDCVAAVNGQTGKVSVRAEKESHYYFLPWWLKAILATAVISGIVYGGLCLFGMAAGERMYLSGLLAIFFLIVTFCAYSDTDHPDFAVEAGRKIFVSQGGAWHRQNGVLVQDPQERNRNVTEPVFFAEIEGRKEPVILRFTTPLRLIRMGLLAILVIFLPVVIALLLNGFDFQRLDLGGSAVWFCIFVPVVPIYVLKFGVIELYERPLIYLFQEDGKKKRYHEPVDWKEVGTTVLELLKYLFIPPACLAVWLAIASFCVICYLTAFGM